MSDISRAGGPFPIGNTYPQSDDKTVTTVQVGENKLSDVAGRLGLDPQDLQKANPQLSDSTVLKAGQEIKLPQNLGQHGPSETRDRDDGVRDMTPRPPSSASGDPLVKGFIQSKLDAAGKQTEFSAKDLGQAAGGASAGRLPSTEYKPGSAQEEYYKIHLENEASYQKDGDKIKGENADKHDIQAFGKESLSQVPGHDLNLMKVVDKTSPLVADKTTPLDKQSPLSFEKVAGGEPLEQVPSNFAKLKVPYEPQKDGTTGPSGPRQGYDVLKLKPL